MRNKNKRNTVLFFIFIAILIFLSYYKTLTLPFYADDLRWMVWGEELIKSPASLFRLEAAMFRFGCKFYYALTALLIPREAVTAAVHFIDIIFLIFNSILAYYFLGFFKINKFVKLFACLVFSIHSYHIGVVYICGSAPETIGSFFYLLALVFTGLAAENKNKHKWIVFILFLAGISFKESAATFVLTGPLFYFMLSKDIKKTFKFFTPVFALFIIYFGLQYYVQSKTYFLEGGNYSFSFLKRNYSQTVYGLFIPFWFEIKIKYMDLIWHLTLIYALFAGNKYLKFFVLWIYITYFPFALLRWGNEFRFSYLPSLGFSVLFAHYVKFLYDKKDISYKLTAFFYVFFSIIYFTVDNNTSDKLQRHIDYNGEAQKTVQFTEFIRENKEEEKLYMLDEERVKYILPDFTSKYYFNGKIYIIKLKKNKIKTADKIIVYRNGNFMFVPPEYIL